MKFVKGQKVIGVNWDFSHRDLIGNVYVVSDYNETPEFGKRVAVMGHGCEGTWFYTCRFETIIQSLDDVIPGMTLTFKYGNTKYTVSSVRDGKIYVFYEGKEYKWGYDIDAFKEYQPKIDSSPDEAYIEAKVWRETLQHSKEKTMNINDYRIAKDFNLIDIYQAGDKTCKVFQDEFLNLMDELTDWEVDECFMNQEELTSSDVFKRNISWLEEKGFIEKKVKDVELKVGMKLRVTWDDDQHTSDYVVTYDNQIINVNTGAFIQFSKTLQDLQNYMDDLGRVEVIEVIDE